MSQVMVKILKDGSGKVCIHWFNRDADGPITTPTANIKTNMGTMEFGGSKGRIACRPNMTDLTPKMVGGMLQTVPHSDDIRGVTCPDCKATAEYMEVAKILNETLDTANVK